LDEIGEFIIMAAPPQTLINENQVVGIRRATPADAELCGRIGLRSVDSPE
jgi:hypothetical protein